MELLILLSIISLPMNIIAVAAILYLIKKYNNLVRDYKKLKSITRKDPEWLTVDEYQKLEEFKNKILNKRKGVVNYEKSRI